MDEVKQTDPPRHAEGLLLLGASFLLLLFAVAMAPVVWLREMARRVRSAKATESERK